MESSQDGRNSPSSTIRSSSVVGAEWTAENMEYWEEKKEPIVVAQK